MDRTRLLSVAVCLLALATLSFARTSPPKILNQSPSYYVVLPREPTEIECEAEGSPAPTYHWQKDGADLEITGVYMYSLNGGNLQVRRPSYATNGIYRCYATNAFGVAMSNKIDFQVAFADAFVDKVKRTYTFREGDVATIPCNQPDSVPLHSIFWTDDANPGNDIPLNNRVSIDPDFNLRFSNINTTDTGNYQCNVKNDKMRLQLLSPVKEVVVRRVENIEHRPATFVYTPPASVDAFRTEKLRLKCMAEGYPTPDITWAKGGESLPVDRTAYESYGQELVISDVMASDVGSYACTASNGGGTPTTFSITVTVKSKPYWENKPEDTNIVINENGVLDCSAEGIPVPMVTWLVNGVPYQEAEANPRLTITEGRGGGRVELTNAITEDSAVFVCVASNEYGEIFASGFINVESIPAEITDAPQRNLNSIEERAFDLTCAGQGSPKPNIQWTFQNNPIVHGESKYIIVEDGNTRSTTSTLTVTGVAVEDSGDYKCIIENGFAAVEATSTVNVRRGTTIVVGPGAEMSVELGADAIIACEVYHDFALQPTVTWYRNVGAGEEELDLTVPGGRFRRAKTGSDNLKMLATVVEDTGTYKCKAVTSEDEASSSTQLVIKTVPAPPSKPIVRKRSDISDTLVAVAWNSGDDGNSQITDYIVSRMTNFPDLGWVVESTVPATSTQASLDLSPYVTYRFRVVAVNDIGESQPSELSDEYTTAAAAITETPDEVGLQATDPGKLDVTWPEVHPYDQNGPGFKYVIRWKEPDAENWNEEFVENYRTTSYEIDDGDIYKELEVEVVYVNDLGEGPASEKSGYTGEGTPTEAPQNVQVIADSPTEVVLTWDEVPASSIKGMLQKFLVYYTMVEAQAQGQEPAECLPNTNCRVGDLTPYMNYQFQVAVRNGQREGEKSAPVSFQMPEGESGPVFGMSIVPLSDRILVKWGKPASPNGVIKGYNLSYNTFDGIYMGKETRVYIGDPEADSYKVESAQPDTNYRISVYATNGHGLGQESTQEIKTRVGGVPPKPLFADAQIAPGRTYINVTFIQKDEGATANEFYVLYKEAHDENADFAETQRVDLLDGNTTTVPGLEPGTEYTLRIVAVNDQGEVAGNDEKARTIADARCTPGALGMENRNIPDNSITASSVYSRYYPTSTARLNVGTQGWVPSTPADQWIQVDLGKPTVVTGLTMQGHLSVTCCHVRAFSVQHSLTAELDDWKSLTNADGGTIRFNLTSGRPTNVTFPVVPTARFIRILPLAWTNQYYRVRFEVFGCQVQVPDGYVRLVNGTDAWSGRVEIYHHDTASWGAVCGKDWGINDANTVCRQLDLGAAIQANTASEYGRGDLPIIMNRVACEGTESRLADCPFVSTSYRHCESSNVAGVVCKSKLNTVRLVGGLNDFSGQVEIFRDDTWGTICDRNWDIRDAGVVCRQLGFPSAVEAKSGAHYGEGSGQVHMEGVACTGSEEELDDCPSLSWTASTCSHSRDAGVICSVETSGSEETNPE